jgi:glutaredoxin
LEGKVGHGTAFGSIFDRIGKNYDRVFIISDMQGSSYINPSMYGSMFVYAVHMSGYNTTMFKPGQKVIDIFGYGSDIYEMIKKAGGKTTVPQIFINSTHIGGCDDIYALERQGKLDALLKA